MILSFLGSTRQKRRLGYLVAPVAVAGTLWIRLAMDHMLNGRPTLVIFTVPIMLSGYYGGFGPGLLATLLSYLAASYYLLPPLLSFAVTSPAERWQQAFVAMAGIFISVLNGALHHSRRRAGEAVAKHLEVQQELRAAIKETADLGAALDEHAIVAITDARGRITFVNDKFCAISQYAREELLGRDHRVINSGYHPPEFFRELWTTIGRGNVWHGEIRNRAKDGSLYWVDTTIVPFLDQGGRLRRYVAIRADITARKLAEEALRQLNQELERRVETRTAELESANRELEAFSYTISHDLRAPLRVIDGFTQAVLEDAGPALSPDAQRQLNVVRRSTERMARLIDDLLRFSRLSRQPLDKQPLNMGQLVASVISEFETERAARGVRVIVGDLPRAEGDPALLRQVWTNLLSNAFKYTGKQPEALIEVGAEMERGVPVYFVRDNGAGFDMRYADKLFGVFRRLHGADEFEGTGVGLAIVRGIVHRHGGRIWADAAVGRGATFYLTLAAPPPA